MQFKYSSISRIMISSAIVLLASPFTHAIEHATISVPDPNGGAPSIINGSAGFNLDAGDVTGEVPIRIGASAADDLTGGVLVGYAYETGRTTPLTLPGPTEDLRAASGTVFDDDPDSLNTRNTSGALAISIHRAGSDTNFTSYPGNARFDTNIAAAYFPFSEGWIGGTLLESGSGESGTFTSLIGGNGASVSDATPNFYEVTITGSDPPVQTTEGAHKLTIPGVSDTRRQGFLFTNYSGGEDLYSLSTPSADGTSFTVETRQVAQDGAQDTFGAFSYVFIPRGTPGITAARVNSGDASSGTDEPTTFISSGGPFTLVREGTAQYRLSIPGQSPSTGTLLVQANGGNESRNDRGSDNIMTYGPDGNDWVIESRDLATLSNLQDSTAARGSFFEFAFIPNTGAPSAPAAIPTLSSLTTMTTSRVVGWNAQVTEVTGGNSFGNMSVSIPSSTSNIDVRAAMQNRGDNGIIVDGAYLSRDEGVMFATPQQGFRDNSLTGGSSGYTVAGVDRTDREWGFVTNAADVGESTGEMNVDFAAVFFGKDSGFELGNAIEEDPNTNVTNVNLAGVNSATDGVLFANFVGNDDNFLTVELDGSGWDIEQYDNDTGNENSNPVNWVYLPYSADNLVAGRVNSNGTMINSTDPNDFSLTKGPTGEYVLTVNGKTPSDGMLLLNADGSDSVSSDNGLSYEPDGSNFRIFGFDFITQAESDAFDVVDLEDTAFSFAFIDFDTPPSLQVDDADFNDDGFVDGLDFLTWQRGVGSGTTFAEGDANGDTMVDAADLAIWELQYGTTGGSLTAATSSVPEPGSAMLLIGIATSLLPMRTNRSGKYIH